jgi:hypothetical protein
MASDMGPNPSDWEEERPFYVHPPKTSGHLPDVKQGSLDVEIAIRQLELNILKLRRALQERK